MILFRMENLFHRAAIFYNIHLGLRPNKKGTPLPRDAQSHISYNYVNTYMKITENLFSFNQNFDRVFLEGSKFVFAYLKIIDFILNYFIY